MPSPAKQKSYRPFTAPCGSACPGCILGGRSHGVRGSGYFAGEGSGQSGLMIVADHLGDDDSGDRALVGSSGKWLMDAMKRAQLRREDCWYETVLRCQPTSDWRDSKTKRRASWVGEAINSCSGYLNAAIASKRPRVFLALGDLAFEALTGLSMTRPLNMMGVRGYVFPEKHGRGWVVPTFHPDMIRLGNYEFATTLDLDLAKALRIAQEGFAYEDDITCLMNPPVLDWERYVEEFIEQVSAETVLAADVETPYKAKRAEAEDELQTVTDTATPDGTDETWQVLCLSLAYEAKRGVTVPNATQYLNGIKRMFQAVIAAGGVITFWNRPYDRPRIMRWLGIDIPVERTRDAFDAFHCLYNHLPRKLGFATSCLPNGHALRAWKHLSQTQPAFYSVMDAVATYRNHRDIMALLVNTAMLAVYDTIMVKLDPALDYMTRMGMPIDVATKARLSEELGARLNAMEVEMDAVVPRSVKPRKVWKTLKGAEGGKAEMLKRGEIVEQEWERVPGTETVNVCRACGELGVTSKHVKDKTIVDTTPPDAIQGGLF